MAKLVMLAYHVALALSALPRASAQATLPKCPYPCGDNTELFCPHRDHVPGGSAVNGSIAAGLGPEDGWDVRVYQVEPAQTKVTLPTFKVMIMDNENWFRYLNNPQDTTVASCKEEVKLNTATNCFSLQTRKCKTHKHTRDPKVSSPPPPSPLSPRPPPPPSPHESGVRCLVELWQHCALTPVCSASRQLHARGHRMRRTQDRLQSRVEVWQGEARRNGNACAPPY